ncbi:MAG: bifunctional metallophosphatase/5'-nucleotidase, partial [Persicimonas sp.]
MCRREWSFPRLVSLGAALLLCVSACSQPQPEPEESTPEADGEPVSLKLVGFNDFHGNLESPSATIDIDDKETDVGGVAHMQSHIDRMREEEPNTMVVSAGDLIGASPLISAVFYDEPTIAAMGELGVELSAVGNHEFDRGWRELVRLQEGGCHPEEGCFGDEEYQGASFQYLAANVEGPEGDSLFPGYQVKVIDGVPVGFIGLVLDDAPDIIAPDAIDGLEFRDEVEVIDQITEELRDEGVESIVVLIHEGGVPTAETASADDCGDLEGPIVDIAKDANDAVDVFVSGHSHKTYICDIDDKLVTSAHSEGRFLTEIDLTLDPQSKDVTAKEASNRPVTNDIEPDEKMSELVARYNEESAEMADKEVDTITAAISREPNEAGESALGGVIADAQLWATRAEDKGGAQLALMNPGGIRSSLDADGDAEGESPVAFEDLHRVQPFGNRLTTITLTGQQIHDALEMQWSGSHPKVLQVSEGFSYTWDESRPPGDRIELDSMRLDGEALEADAEYRVTVNSFLASGGDGFSVFKEGADRRAGEIDLEALEA